MYHGDAYSRFIFDRFQYVARASPDATPATGATAFHYADDLVPVFLFSIQVERDPQEDGNSYSDICDIHFFIVLYGYLSIQTNERQKYFILREFSFEFALLYDTKHVFAVLTLLDGMF
jgi:hypothetical protein